MAGYDCLMIDQEHGAIDQSQLLSLLLAIERHQVIPLARVPALEPDPIKRMLDMGIENLMLPGIVSVGQLEEMIAACRYPPLGTRGIALGSARATKYGKDTQGYLSQLSQRQAILVQIETQAALRDIDSLASVEGVDMLFIGPNDLSAAIGYFGKLDHPDVLAAFAHIERAAKSKGKALGTIPSPGRDAKSLFALGYQLVLSGADMLILRHAAQERVKAERP